MNYTYATVLVDAANRVAAQAELGEGFFNTALSESGAEPATHYMSSGPFNNAEMDLIVNESLWPKKVYFGQDWVAALEAEHLRVIVPPNP